MKKIVFCLKYGTEIFIAKSFFVSIATDATIRIILLLHYRMATCVFVEHIMVCTVRLLDSAQKPVQEIPKRRVAEVGEMTHLQLESVNIVSLS